MGGKPSGLSEAYRRAGPYMGLGIEFAVTIIVCFVAGRWADEWLGASPYLALVGLFLGMTTAFINLMRTVNRLAEKGKESGEDPEGGAGV